MNGYANFARYYDRLTANIDYSARARYFDAVIRRHDGVAGILLDLACGTGSLSLEMASLGYDVIGVDASGDMLSVAMQKAAENGRQILFLHQKMEKLDLYGTVDCCVCALDSLNHLPNEAALCRTLDKLSLFVRPGGLFVFDVNSGYKHRHVLGDNAFVYDVPPVYCVWQNAADKNGDVQITLDFFEKQDNGCYARYSEQFCETLFAPEILDRLLAARGFKVLGVYGDDSFEPPGETTQRLVYVTVKG